MGALGKHGTLDASSHDKIVKAAYGDWTPSGPGMVQITSPDGSIRAEPNVPGANMAPDGRFAGPVHLTGRLSNQPLGIPPLLKPAF